MKNTAVIVVTLGWAVLAALWAGYYLWKVSFTGQDYSIAKFVVGPLNLVLVLATDRVAWFAAFLLVSVVQSVLAYYLFSE